MWNTRKQTTNEMKKQICCEWCALEFYQPIGGLFLNEITKKNQLCLCSWDEWLSCDKSQLKWCCYWLANLQIKMNLLSSFHSSFYWFFGSKRRKMWDKHSINMSLIQQPLALKVACCYIVCLLTVSFIVAVALYFFSSFFHSIALHFSIQHHILLHSTFNYSFVKCWKALYMTKARQALEQNWDEMNENARHDKQSSLINNQLNKWFNV